MKNIWEEEPVVCFTSDIDWASEDMIKKTFQLLGLKSLKITIFNTHQSSELKTKLINKEIDMLIHPNFLPNSSHGNSFEEIIENCLKFCPEAKGFRSHRYFEVNDIFEIFNKYGFKYFSNFCTRCENYLRPNLHRSGLLSIPIFFEDGGFLLMDPTLNFNNFLENFSKPGLKVINFHPAHICFNTPDFQYTRKIKDSVSRKEWNNLSAENLKRIEYDKFGIRNFIENMIEYTQKKNMKLVSLEEIFKIWSSS